MRKQQEEQEGEDIVQQLHNVLQEKNQAAKKAKKRQKNKLKKFNSWRKRLEAWRIEAQQRKTALDHVMLEHMGKFHIIMVFYFCRLHFCLFFNCFNI